MALEGKHPDFIVRQADPLNGGPPLADLAAAQRTPVEQFFVRSHGAIPEASAESWRLRISGLVRQSFVTLRSRPESRGTRASERTEPPIPNP